MGLGATDLRDSHFQVFVLMSLGVQVRESLGGKKKAKNEEGEKNLKIPGLSLSSEDLRRHHEACLP